MGGATLIISRSENELNFVLQLSQAQHPAVMQARTTLFSDQRKQIFNAFEDFAECLEGFDADEPKFKELGQILFRILLPQTICIQIQALEGPLTILTDDPTLPWEIMHDGKEFLALRLPIARLLIIHEQMRSLLQPPQFDTEAFSVLIIADPTGDLPGARKEGEELYKFFNKTKGKCELLKGEMVSWQSILGKLVSQPYSIIHFCGHVDYHPDERQSSIRLRDGRLYADKVLPAFQGTPIVFLNACYSDLRLDSSINSNRADNFARTESFAQAFMLGSERGVARAVVGAMWRIPDEPQEAGWKFSQAFYQHLLEGQPIGEALRHSRNIARNRKWGPMVWGPYVLYGDPNLKLFADIISQRKKLKTYRKPKQDAQESEPVPIEEPAVEETAPDHTTTGEETKTTSPLDTSARRIFFTALSEMKQMNQNWLSSLHLLIGLCKGGIEIFEQVLSEKRTNVEKVAGIARQRATEMLPQGKSMGISTNVIKAIAFALERVSKLGKKRITGEDLLAGLLSRQNSEAVKILAELGVTPDDILRRLPRPPETSTTHFKFDAQTNEAIQHAIKTAMNARLNFLGTPHLLIGLVRTGGLQTITLLRKKNINLEELCDALMAGLGKGSSSTNEDGKSISLVYRPRCYKVLKRARALAKEDAREAISETDLLRALLEEQEGFTATVLQKMGAGPGDMLKILKDSDQGSDKSSKSTTDY